MVDRLQPPSPDVPVKDLCRLLRVEDEAGVVPPQHGHDAQTQPGGVAPHQGGGLQQQLGLHQAELVQELEEWGTSGSGKDARKHIGGLTSGRLCRWDDEIKPQKKGKCNNNV